MAKCTITISAPLRGLAAGDKAVFTPAEAVVTWSWGLQPATALIDWVSATPQGALAPGSSVKIELATYTFYGVTDNLVQRIAADGYSVMQEFRDNREFLMWDEIYAAFNLHDARIINGQYQKRYRHLLPGDYAANNWTFTNAPYSAWQILQFLLGSKTVGSPWTFVEHSLMTNPVYELDYTNGQKLGQVLVDISEKLGLVFTLMGGPFTLVWALKGSGALPSFPATSDNRRIGSALSGNPTRVRILGDRNRYQLFNVALVPDWLPAWSAFWDFSSFVDDIYNNEVTDGPVVTGDAQQLVPAGTRYNAIANDPDHVIGYTLAGARARLLTVGQYATLRDARVTQDGALFRDYRRFQGRSRLNLPVALYLAQLLFRAFKLPDNFTFTAVNGAQIGRYGYDLDSKPIVEVTHDPLTGFQQPAVDSNKNYLVPASEHNGYAVVQGYQVAADGFGTLNPDYFDYQRWVSAQLLWQYAPFQIDDSGEGTQFVLFDAPVINSGDLVKQAANGLSAGQIPVTLNANPTFTIPPVSATLSVLADRFSYVAGTGTRDDVNNIAGLNGEFLMLKPGASVKEQAWADGLTASAKAASYAALLLNQQLFYQNGGYLVAGTDGSTLSSVVDRITLRWNAKDGLTQEVDFTNERSRNVTVGPLGTAVVNLEPERAFDRRSQLDPLWPGQEQLRAEARQLRLSAAVLRANPQMLQAMVDTFHRLQGYATTAAVITDSYGSGNAVAGAGTPLWRDASRKVCFTPSDTSTTAQPNAVFVGVTTLDGDGLNGSLHVTATGADGIILVRVALGASDQPRPGMAVGLPADKVPHTYLGLNPATMVGVLVDDWSQNQVARVVLTRVRVSGGGTSGGGWNYRGLYDPTVTYNANDVVQMGVGTSAGMYLATVNGPAAAPDSGIGWVQISTAQGTWL